MTRKVDRRDTEVEQGEKICETGENEVQAGAEGKEG